MRPEKNVLWFAGPGIEADTDNAGGRYLSIDLIHESGHEPDRTIEWITDTIARLEMARDWLGG